MSESPYIRLVKDKDPAPVPNHVHDLQTSVELVFGYNPHGMDDAGDEAEDRQQDVDPEVFTDPDLQEHPQGREDYRDYDTQHVHRNPPSVCLTSVSTTLPNPGSCKHEGARGGASSQVTRIIAISVSPGTR